MRRGAGTGLALAGGTSVRCVCVCEGAGCQRARPGGTDPGCGVGAGCPQRALPSLTQPLRPPNPKEQEQRGRRLWAPRCLTGSDGGVSPGSTSCLSGTGSPAPAI